MFNRIVFVNSNADKYAFSNLMSYENNSYAFLIAPKDTNLKHFVMD